MIRPAEWFLAESTGAPEALRGRAAGYLERVVPQGGVAEALAEAAALALRETLAHDGGRSIALDLLAADALVTLALLAKAQGDPGSLAEFAAGLRTAEATLR